jgi:hypothetical protein
MFPIIFMFLNRNILLGCALRALTFSGSACANRFNVHRKTPRVNRAANVAAALVRAPFGGLWLNALPDRLIYQRCYVAH